jgi:hypothetical protein
MRNEKHLDSQKNKGLQSFNPSTQTWEFAAFIELSNNKQHVMGKDDLCKVFEVTVKFRFTYSDMQNIR